MLYVVPFYKSFSPSPKSFQSHEQFLDFADLLDPLAVLLVMPKGS